MDNRIYQQICLELAKAQSEGTGFVVIIPRAGYNTDGSPTVTFNIWGNTSSPDEAIAMLQHAIERIGQQEVLAPADAQRGRPN